MRPSNSQTGRDLEPTSLPAVGRERRFLLRGWRLLYPLASLLLAGSWLVSAYPGPQQREEDRDRGYRGSVVAESVIVDFVVKDRSGRTVDDLEIGELEVYENGERQEITSFQLIRREAPEAAERRTPDLEAPLLDEVAGERRDIDPAGNLVTLVFERLGNEARQLSRRAALDFLETQLDDGMLAAVFVIGQRLSIVQPFTRDREALQEAVEQVTSRGAVHFASASETIRQQLETVAFAEGLASQQTGVVGEAMSPDPSVAGSFAQATLAQMQVNMLQYSEEMQREQQGQTSLFSLLSLVREQARWAGRKTLIYFSEGLHVPPMRTTLFRTIVGEANRSRVSVYSVDARGLITAAQSDAGRQALEQATQTSRTRMMAGDGRSVSRDEVMLGEAAEASIRMNVQENLAELATSTGGFLLANTNDLRPGLRLVAEDMGHYYEISYTPTNRVYDGTFREIAVNVSRPGVLVQSRSGYFALPPVEGPPVLPYEIPLLTALNSAPLPRDFEFRSRALRLDPAPHGVHHTLVLEVPLNELSLKADRERDLYTTRFSLLALLRDPEGKVLEKFSQDYPLEGPLDRLEALRKGAVVFLRDIDLEPGRYTLEAAVHDHVTAKSSVRRSVLVVPSIPSDLSLSHAVLVRRTEQAEAGSEQESLRYEEFRVIPLLDEVIDRKELSHLAIYFVIYGSTEIPEPPSATLELHWNGQVLGRSDLEIDSAAGRSRIPQFATLPLESLPPGRHEIRVTARQGDSRAEERVFFTLVP